MKALHTLISLFFLFCVAGARADSDAGLEVPSGVDGGYTILPSGFPLSRFSITCGAIRRQLLPQFATENGVTCVSEDLRDESQQRFVTHAGNLDTAMVRLGVEMCERNRETRGFDLVGHTFYCFEPVPDGPVLPARAR
jgi:hypothetical protein